MAREMNYLIDDMRDDVVSGVTEVNGESAVSTLLKLAVSLPMATPTEDSIVRPLTSWTVDQLKEYLRDHHFPVSGTKSELVKRVGACYDTEFLESELEVVPFQHFSSDVPIPTFESLPVEAWTTEKLPLIQEEVAINYLKKKGGYTKNFRTGVRLCQCGHLYDIAVASTEVVMEEDGHVELVSYIRAKCRPTMRKKNPFYPLFVMVLDDTPMGGNCFCAAGASQNCVHIAALLLTLAEMTPTACTSMRCAWSRPSTGSTASLANELDFGKASSEGYVPYNGPKPSIDVLLQDLQAAGSKPGIGDYFSWEKLRQASVSTSAESEKFQLKDPVDTLLAIAEGEPTVENVISALGVTPKEIELLQVMTIGQRNNPMWMDARQWRITASNFGRVCNRNFRVLYPPSLKKILLGDYGHPNSAAINWGITHEDEALSAYQRMTNTEVDLCGIFLSVEFPFLGASPDGITYIDVGKIALVEVKCPYKHRHDSIADACTDPKFCLTIENGEPMLRRKHDYYYQVIGQLGITKASYCDFVVWTLTDMHIERIYIDIKLWEEMTEKLKQYYYTTLAPEIINRILES